MTPENKGTMIIDASCAPQYIAYPQDINLLEDARKKLESMIDHFCRDHSLEKPRTYRKEARKAYLSIARSRKKTTAKLRKGIKAQLQYIKRDLSYIDDYLETGYAVDEKTTEGLMYGTGRTVYIADTGLAKKLCLFSSLITIP